MRKKALLSRSDRRQLLIERAKAVRQLCLTGPHCEVQVVSADLRIAFLIFQEAETKLCPKHPWMMHSC